MTLKFAGRKAKKGEEKEAGEAEGEGEQEAIATTSSVLLI